MTEFISCDREVARAVLNSLSAHIAILDEKGVILETNNAWQNFALRNGMGDAYDTIGVNYLQLCDAADGEGAEDAHLVAEGIRNVITGSVQEFLHDYPCHSPDEQHWYYMRAFPMPREGLASVVISHEEITALKLAEKALLESRGKLQEQKQSLEEANIALKVLLKRREEDRFELERRVLSNIKDLVMPYVDKLKLAPLKSGDKVLVEMIDRHLQDIISPLLQKLANINIILTPQEVQVAALVKDGKTSKEIADILSISDATVNFHRKNLRSKFGLKNRQVNLRTYLLSLAP